MSKSNWAGGCFSGKSSLLSHTGKAMYIRTEWPRLVGLGRLVCGYRGGHFIDTDNSRTETKAWVLSGMAFCNILISSQIDQKWRLAPGKRPQNAWGWPQSLKRPQNGCRVQVHGEYDHMWLSFVISSWIVVKFLWFYKNRVCISFSVQSGMWDIIDDAVNDM